MPIGLKQKKEIVAEVTGCVSKALSVVAADYRGLTAPEMTELRSKARSTGVVLKIVRNTLAKRAFQGTHYEGMVGMLTGSVLLAFANEEPSATARLVRDFAKQCGKLEVRAISVDGQLYGENQLEQVASLPTKDEALAKLLAVIQAPIVKLVRTLSEPHAKLVRTLAAIRDSKAN